MNVYPAAAVVLSLVVVQTTVMPFAALESAKPFLPVLAVVSWGLVRGLSPAVWWAIALGTSLDLISPAPPGLYTLPMLVAAAVVAVGGTRLFPTHFFLPGLVAGLATMAFTLTQRAMMSLAVATVPGAVAWTWPAVLDDVVPVLVLNLLWMPVLYFPLRWVAQRTGPPRIGWEW